MFIEKNGFIYDVPETDKQTAREEQREELRKVLDAEPYFVNRGGCDILIELARNESVNGLICRLPAHTFGRRKGHGLWPNSRLTGR